MPGMNSMSPLRTCSKNPRYFTNDAGKTVYLTGSHTWASFQDMGLEGDKKINYDEFLDMLESHHHNFTRMWQWGHPLMAPWTEDRVYFEPMPYKRTGPGAAADGKPRFNLDQWNEAYFDRLRSRFLEEGKR